MLSGFKRIQSPDPVTPLVPALVPSLVPRAVGEKCPESRFDDWRGYSGAHWSFSIFVFENPLAGARTGGRLKTEKTTKTIFLSFRASEPQTPLNIRMVYELNVFSDLEPKGANRYLDIYMHKNSRH